MKLNQLAPDEGGRILYIPPELAVRLEKMGMRVTGRIRCLFRAPAGDPVAYLVDGCVLALRREEAGRVEIEPWD